MKSYFRILFTGILLLSASQLQAQIEWNEIPAIPLNPSAGQTSPQSYNVSISDDGRMYATYIFDNGTNQQIYFQEYVAGSGWNLIYNEQVYSGFEAIHSYSQGGVNYILVKTDNASAVQKMRLYSISNGSVAIQNDYLFSDIPNGAEFRTVLSEDGNNIYMLHKDFSGTVLKLTQLNFLGGTVLTLAVPNLAASGNYNYDLIEMQDTVYVGVTRDETAGEYRVYFHKAPESMTGVVSHHPGNPTGQMGLVSYSPTLMGIMMSKDFTNQEVFIATNDGTANFTYKFDPSTLTTVFGTASPSYCPSQSAANQPATVILTDRSLHFGGFNSVYGSSFLTNVVEQDFQMNQASASATTNFNSISTFGSNYKMSYAESVDQGIASVYDNNLSTTRYFNSNHVPSIIAAGIPTPVCPFVNSQLVSGMQVYDADATPISITSITSNNTTIFPNGNIVATIDNISGSSYFFSLNGTPQASGDATITVTYSDGINSGTQNYTITVIPTVAPPTFNQSNITICSNNGLVDLSSYVSQVGGTFAIGGVSAPFNGMFYNSNLTGLPYETAMQLDYTITSAGCNLSASAQLTLHESATVTVATTPTSCGGTTGTAIATIAGGTNPFLLQAWSSGETSVTSVDSLAQGTYTFTVQDANLCSVIKEFTIVPTGVDIIPTITNASCFGANNGSLSVTLTGFSAPSILIWSSGHSSTSVGNLTPGTYTITVTDASNCIYTEAFTITQPSEITGSTVVNSPTCGNTDGTMEVQNIAGGSGTHTVNWSTGGTNALETNVGYGVYSATITDNTGCQTIKTVFVSEQNSANLIGSITGSQCGSSTGEIDVTPIMASGQTVQQINWSTGQNTEDLSLIPPALYICTLTTNANCHAVKGWNIPIVAPELQPICVVTVDSVTSTNLVVWEEVQPIGIHHYNIYRETSVQGEYILIDTVEATNTSLFNDVVASPVIRSWSYKISAVNGCNVEGPLSPQHRTMHLNAIDAGSPQTQISWNAYEGTAYSNFVLWRYTDANLWEPVGTLPITQVSYIDNTDFSTPGLDYMVELSLDEQCSALKYMAQDFNTTRSNKDKGNFSVGEGTGDSNNELNVSFLNEISLFPNPTTGLLNIEQITAKTIEIELTDLTGKKILSSELNTLHSVLDMNELKPGTYLIEMTLNNTKRIARIVKI